MKRGLILFLLAVSLAANAMLAWRFSARSHSAGNTGAPAVSKDQLPSDAAPLPTSDAQIAAQVKRWRASGVPAALVRSWVTAEINQRYAAREKALLPPPRQHYWQTAPQRLLADRLALTDLAVEKTLLLDQLLGYDPSRPENEPYRFLPREKQEAVKRIAEAYAARWATLRNATWRMPTAAEEAALARLESERAEALRPLLSDTEQTQLGLRLTVARWPAPAPDALGNNSSDINQPLVTKLRSDLRFFDATEAEFLAIQAIQQEAEPFRKFGGMDTQVLNRQVEDKVRAALGEERFAEYRVKSTFDYNNIGQLVERMGLPSSTAAEIGAIRFRTADESLRIADDTSLDVTAKKDALRNLAVTERAHVTSLLGAEGTKALNGTLNRWLQPLEQGRVILLGPGGNGGSSPAVDSPSLTVQRRLTPASATK